MEGETRPVIRRVFYSVTAVRGLAALAVCWFHVAGWSYPLPPGLLRRTAHLGWMGPHIFFIVSGFVVPWSLYVMGYRWRDAHRYLGRRLLRLDPPYFATIALVLVLAYLGSWLGVGDPRPVFDPVRLLSHIAYLASILGDNWYNPVFWTLAIEFQFYLFIGLMLPWLANPNTQIRRIAMVACLAAYAPFAAGPGYTWVTGYLPLFMLGFVLFQRHAGLIGRGELVAWVLLLASLVAFTFVPYLAATSVAAFGFMLLDRFRSHIVEFFGRISYSLYLTHWPVGILILRFAYQWELGDTQKIAVAFSAMAACVLIAWLFYRLVELPSIHLARRMSLKPRPRQPRSVRRALVWPMSPKQSPELR